MQASEITELLILAFCWAVYFIVHSVLASLTFKRWFADRNPGLMPWYRLSFNVLSVVLLVPPLVLMHEFGGNVLWQWAGPWKILSITLALFAVLGFIWSLRFYDGMDFLGFRQIKAVDRDIQDKEKFCLSPLHRIVRHPWYFFAIVIIWTRDMDSAFLVSAVCMTLYFIAGSVLEERKLVRLHGEVYRHYMKYVPGIFPLPWRYLDKKGLDELKARHVIEK